MKLKSLLKNKTFLYFVLFIAVVNLFGYLMMRQLEIVMLFALVGFLTTYFSKNMVIVLLTTIVVTNLFAGSKLNINFREGLESKNDEDHEDHDEKKDEDEEDKEGLKSLSPSDYPPNGKKSKIDTSGTIEAAYDRLDKILDSDAINKMSSETQNLAAQQDKLMQNIDKIAPMLSTAEGMMEKLTIMGGKNEKAQKKILEMTGGIDK
tara:strand:+ start:821 stop:1438 length:618 start_codon:yes stop_codon:yes gene_type:complete